MSTMLATTEPTAEVIYPSSDGKRMAENTLQARWIVLMLNNLNLLFSRNQQVFVACDLLWYPVKDEPKINQAPDVMVVFGRPKGDRPSWIQYREDDIPPQVVFAILSPSNSWMEMADKLHFYDQYGVEEYYTYDPERKSLTAFQRQGSVFRRILALQNWVSPRLKIRIEWSQEGEDMKLFLPDGRPFITPEELDASRQQVEQRLLESQEQLLASKAKIDQLAAKLRELGIDPDTVK